VQQKLAEVTAVSDAREKEAADANQPEAQKEPGSSDRGVDCSICESAHAAEASSAMAAAAPQQRRRQPSRRSEAAKTGLQQEPDAPGCNRYKEDLPVPGWTQLEPEASLERPSCNSS
jgi:hypothetical protein